MDTNTTGQNSGKNNKKNKGVPGFDSKKFDKKYDEGRSSDDFKLNDNSDLTSGRPYQPSTVLQGKTDDPNAVPMNSGLSGSSLDQDTYGNTGTNTTATGGGTSGGFGSTGGSIASGSSDYADKKDFASDTKKDEFNSDSNRDAGRSTSVHEYESPMNMSSSSGSFPGAPSGSGPSSGAYSTSDATKQAEASPGKAGVGENGSHVVSGRSDTDITGTTNATSSFSGNTTLGGSIGGAQDNRVNSGGVNFQDSRINESNTAASVGSKVDSSAKGSDTKSKDHQDLQGMIMSQIAELGDILERAGEKIEQAGFSKIGDAIYRLGDRLEHLKDGKKGPSVEKADDAAEVDSLNTGSLDVTPGSMGARTDLKMDKDPKQASGSDQSQAY